MKVRASNRAYQLYFVDKQSRKTQKYRSEYCKKLRQERRLMHDIAWITPERRRGPICPPVLPVDKWGTTEGEIPPYQMFIPNHPEYRRYRYVYYRILPWLFRLLIDPRDQKFLYWIKWMVEAELDIVQFNSTGTLRDSKRLNLAKWSWRT